MRSLRHMLLAGSLGFSATAFAQVPVQQSAAPTTAVPTQQQSPALQQGIAALHAGQPQQALALFQQDIVADPQGAAPNLLAASAEIALYQPLDAIRYGERALALEPDNWKIHTTLVTAYAMAGDLARRDAERAILRKAHDNPALPDARETNGFLLEMFRAGRYSVEAVEYFHPVGRYNTYFRFVIRNAAKTHVWTIEVNSDSLNQSSWAQSYPKQAKEGQRQFQIESAQGESHVEYRTFSGSAGYDYIKSQIIKIVEAQTTPFPGEAQAK